MLFPYFVNCFLKTVTKLLIEKDYVITRLACTMVKTENTAKFSDLGIMVMV